MCNKGNYLVIGHPCRANDTNDARHTSRAVLSSDDGKRLELGIQVLVADAYRDSRTSAPLAEQVGEMLVSFRKCDELPHVVDRAELRLFREQRRLSEENRLVALNCRLEKLLAFLDEH